MPAATAGPAPAGLPEDTRPPSQAYADGVAAGRWLDDPAQRTVLAELDRIHAALARARRRGPLRRLTAKLRPPDAVGGLYLWGGVGRGKTFLVDLFYDHAPVRRRHRVHFHRFMQDIHARMAALGQHSDPLARVASDLAARVRLLVLDEFFVSDIGDAMILARLLEGLFQRGVTLVTTSNIEPAGLYREGLQRARFLPAIALLEGHCAVVEMASDRDYRLRQLEQAGVYHSPLGPGAESAMAAAWAALAADCPREEGPLAINDRLLHPRALAEGVAWFDFAELCDGPRAVADYIELARDFHTLLLSDVPAFDEGNENPARRFVHLVDELYDRGVNLVLSADRDPLSLYQGQRLAREFERTGSRLVEMQGVAYLGGEHKG
ncbi:MAG: cell division protein ZapE [Lysobacteraceae bacterium]